MKKMVGNAGNNGTAGGRCVARLWVLDNPAVCYRPPHSRVYPGIMSAGMTATKLLKVRVDPERCQGHARCFALAPELFELDQLGNARERGDGTVAPGLEAKASSAQANCPEFAIDVIVE